MQSAIEQELEQFYSVPHHQCVQFVWQGEHHMVIVHRQELGLTGFEPSLGGAGLTLGALLSTPI